MPINGSEINFTSLRLSSFQHPSSINSAQTAADRKWGSTVRNIDRNCPDWQKLQLQPTGKATPRPWQPSARRPNRSMSRLQQSVFGDEPLHAFPFQKLHGSPVDLAAVLGLPEWSQLLLDVLEPQIYGDTKLTVHFDRSSVTVLGVKFRFRENWEWNGISVRLTGLVPLRSQRQYNSRNQSPCRSPGSSRFGERPLNCAHLHRTCQTPAGLSRSNLSDYSFWESPERGSAIQVAIIAC